MLPFFSFLFFEPENLQVVNVHLSEPTYSDEKLVIESSAIMSLQDDQWNSFKLLNHRMVSFLLKHLHL